MLISGFLLAILSWANLILYLGLDGEGLGGPAAPRVNLGPLDLVGRLRLLRVDGGQGGEGRGVHGAVGPRRRRVGRQGQRAAPRQRQLNAFPEEKIYINSTILETDTFGHIPWKKNR